MAPSVSQYVEIPCTLHRKLLVNKVCARITDAVEYLVLTLSVYCIDRLQLCGGLVGLRSDSA